MNVEHGTFTPLVFSLTGGEGPEEFLFHKNIVQKISATTEENYDRVLSLIRCKLSFLICVRESCSVINVHLDDVSLTGHCSKFLSSLLLNLNMLFVKSRYLLPM